MLALSFDPLYKIIGWLLAFFYYFPPHSLGLAIALMTIVVMLVQFPLIAKQTRSMILMQRVQPEIKKIQQKYKDDRQKQNEELLKFYQENKINPLAGCLPLLIIMPIGIAVWHSFQQGAVLDNKGIIHHGYRGLQGHIPRTGPFSLLYKDICGSSLTPVAQCAKDVKLHTPHAMYFLSMNLTWSAREVSSKLPGEFLQWVPYYMIIALVIVTGWYQVRQTQARQLQSGSAANTQMQMVTKIMPLFFGLITFSLNAATTFYFFVSNLWRIGQQHLVLNKMYEEAAAPKPKPSPATDTKAAGDGKPNGKGATGPDAKPGPNGSGKAASRPSENAARRKKKRKR